MLQPMAPAHRAQYHSPDRRRKIPVLPAAGTGIIPGATDGRRLAPAVADEGPGGQPEARRITCAGYLNSLLNPLEQQAMLDKLRLGGLGLIFVAPEQFRSTAFSNALAHRGNRCLGFR